jgi:hypothetical protein
MILDRKILLFVELKVIRFVEICCMSGVFACDRDIGIDPVSNASEISIALSDCHVLPRDRGVVPQSNGKLEAIAL